MSSQTEMNDYCTKGQVLITMPRMFVQGTGGIGQPAQTEVALT
ncbi:MAG TPA: hypothetical protein PLM56_02520 [Cyclobacteriaceae bacterium]|nr:hypothetical protein [Cyclobacteriaceae bacterium]HRF32347.1 hypothetical protein [Cyclobacteriaceae bacterium]